MQLFKSWSAFRQIFFIMYIVSNWKRWFYLFVKDRTWITAVQLWLKTSNYAVCMYRRLFCYLIARKQYHFLNEKVKANYAKIVVFFYTKLYDTVLILSNTHQNNIACAHSLQYLVCNYNYMPYQDRSNHTCYYTQHYLQRYDDNENILCKLKIFGHKSTLIVLFLSTTIQRVNMVKFMHPTKLWGNLTSTRLGKQNSHNSS